MNEIELLREACTASSQSAVAKKIGYSPTVVNLVLKGTYMGDMDKVKRLIRLRLGRTTISCPVLGEIDHARCSAEQNKDFSMSNSQTVRLFKACRVCAYNIKRSS